MNVFRHEDKSQQRITMLRRGPVDRLGQQATPLVVRQQGPAAIARKRQFMHAPITLEMLDGFTMARAHARDFNSSSSSGKNPRRVSAGQTTRPQSSIVESEFSSTLSREW